MIAKAKRWLAIGLACLGAGCATFSHQELGARLIERGHIAAIDVQPVANDLMFLWEHTDSVEWSACAHGELRGDTLVITQLELANMDSWTPVSVAYTKCPASATYIGSIHPHKAGSDNMPVEWRCQPSGVDMAGFLADPREAFMFIECDRGRLWVSMQKVSVGDTLHAHPR